MPEVIVTAACGMCPWYSQTPCSTCGAINAKCTVVDMKERERLIREEKRHAFS